MSSFDCAKKALFHKDVTISLLVDRSIFSIFYWSIDRSVDRSCYKTNIMSLYIYVCVRICCFNLCNPINQPKKIELRTLKIELKAFKSQLSILFFHKYSLVGCQQNLEVFIFFDYSGLF